MQQHQKYGFAFMLIFISATAALQAQQTGDDFKKKLRESLKIDDGKVNTQLKYKPQTIEQYDSDVLKISPTTKLPTKYDKLLSLPLPLKPNIEMNVTNRETGPLADKIDYSTKKLLPDAVPSSLHSKIIRPIGPSVTIGDLDLDPVRAIQAYKRQKRQKKIDKIKQAYDE